MNLLLLHPNEISPDGSAVLNGRRALHARQVLRAAEGDSLRVGVRGGKRGLATVSWEGPETLKLRVDLTDEPPPRPGIDLLLAIPRPKALRRVIPAVASLGVDRVVLLNAARVEKSFFDAKVLSAESLDALIDLGLEQAKDTVPPTVELRHRFRPFVEDELDTWAPAGAVKVTPHPTASQPAGPLNPQARIVIAIGPDGGWVPFEVELLSQRGFTPISLGARVLRGETAVPAVIAAVRPTLTLQR